MSYQENIKAHLGEYKKKHFPGSEHGLWMRSDPPKVLDYAFIPKDRNNNLLKPYKADFLKSPSMKGINAIKLHMYFHHLNSSQAMCINFFYPLMVEKQLELVLNFLKFDDEEVNYDTVQFEKNSTIDSKGGRNPTNFDFYLKTKSNKEFFFEIKYTEQGFGSVKNDDDHISKYDSVYKDNFEAITPDYQQMNIFFKHYQIIRNLIHLGKDKYVVFLYPKGNKRVDKGAMKAKNEILKEEFRANFFTVYWEDLFDSINPNLTGYKLNQQFNDFKLKYLP